MTMNIFEAPEPFGPVYPDLGLKVRKLRNAKPYDAKAHGFAVLAAIQTLNRNTAARREVSPVSNSCYASGSPHSDGMKILAAVRKQNRSA